MTIWTFVALAGGLASSVGGAEFLARRAAAIASRLGIAPVVIAGFSAAGALTWRQHRTGGRPGRGSVPP